MSEKRFVGKLLTNSNGEEFGFTIYDNEKRLNIKDVVGLLNDQQDNIDKLQRYNDVLHDENLFNTMKMLEFMKEKGVFDEFYDRIKKEVFGDE